MTLKIFNFCFLLVMYVHLIACIWYYLVRQNKAWVPPLDFMWFQIYPDYGQVQPFSGVYHLY